MNVSASSAAVSLRVYSTPVGRPLMVLAPPVVEFHVIPFTTVSSPSSPSTFAVTVFTPFLVAIAVHCLEVRPPVIVRVAPATSFSPEMSFLSISTSVILSLTVIESSVL